MIFACSKIFVPATAVTLTGKKHLATSLDDVTVRELCKQFIYQKRLGKKSQGPIDKSVKNFKLQ